MKNKVIKYIKKPSKIILYLMNKGMANFIDDETYLKVKYYLIMGNKLNINNPKTFNEKLQWLKLHDRNSKYVKMVDKYYAKNYVSNIIGDEYIIPTLGIYDTFEEINFNELPNEFVLKPTHTSGDIFICKDKNKIDYNKLRKKIKRWLKRNYYLLHREWPYKNIKPKIIIEKYMKMENKEELIDYKFMCFNGKVKCSFVCLDRNSQEGLKVDFYDLEWRKMPFQRHYPNSNTTLKKPKNYELMVELSEKLSKNIPFVRVDFYEINDKLYFGEMTFFPGAGFEEFTPEKYDEILGDMLELPIEKRKENEK